MGAISFSLSEAIKTLSKKKRKIKSSIFRTSISLTPLIAVLLLALLIMTGESGREVLELEVATAMGVIASAPGQPVVARAAADNEVLKDRRVASAALILGIIVPTTFSTALVPLTEYLMSSLGCKSTYHHLALQYLTATFYSISTAFYALAVEKPTKYVVGMTLPWIILVLPTFVLHRLFKESLTISLLISTTAAVISELLLYYLFLYKPVGGTGYSTIRHLRVTICFTFDSLSLMVASTLYYLFLFADKLEWLASLGMDSLTLLRYAFVGSFPLIGGVLAGNAFWYGPGRLLSDAYEVTRTELNTVVPRVMRGFHSNMALAGSTAAVMANVIVSLELGYLDHHLFVSMVAYMVAYMLSRCEVCSMFVFLLTVAGDAVALHACAVGYWSIYDYILCTYSVVGVIGAGLIYVYSQLIGLKRETEAAALMGIPVVTAMGIDWITGNPYLLPVGLASGALVAKILGTILLTVMYRELDATILRVLAYNSMVSYLLEVKGVVPDLEEGGE